MGFTMDEGMVRVDFFKLSGKWYTTEAVKWITYWSPRSKYLRGDQTGLLIHDAFKEALKAHLWNEEDQRYRLSDMEAVCLEPYHEGAFPLMMRRWADDG